MRILFIILGVLIFSTAHAQLSEAARDSINKQTQIDYQQMLNQLGISNSELRPGPSGNPSAPNAANRFEDKVNSYTLPDPLITKDGRKVKDAKMWWDMRRPEIVKDFENEIY